jgi:hypothetical protein
MTELLPPLGLNKYNTWRILPVKCYIDNHVRLWSCIRNVNTKLLLMVLWYHSATYDFCEMCETGEDAEQLGGLPSCPIMLYRLAQTLYCSL